MVGSQAEAAGAVHVGVFWREHARSDSDIFRLLHEMARPRKRRRSSPEAEEVKEEQAVPPEQAAWAAFCDAHVECTSPSA